MSNYFNNGFDQYLIKQSHISDILKNLASKYNSAADTINIQGAVEALIPLAEAGLLPSLAATEFLPSKSGVTGFDHFRHSFGGSLLGGGSEKLLNHLTKGKLGGRIPLAGSVLGAILGAKY